MSNKAKPARDAFTFSLGGISTISSFVAAPAIAHDQLNKALDGRLGSPGGASGYCGVVGPHKVATHAIDTTEPGFCPALFVLLRFHTEIS
jgi:hypothetical protein